MKKLPDIDQQLLQITRLFLREIRAEQAARALFLEASLEHDLGLGSLERAELAQRVENAFAIQLPVSLLAEVTVLRDFVPLIAAKSKLVSLAATQVPQLSASALDPSHAQTLTELLAQYAQAEPERPHIYLQDEEGQEQTISYGELFITAGRIAEALVLHQIKPHDTVALMLPTSREYFFCFFAILLAGGIPVPIYPPVSTAHIEEYVRRQAKVLNNAESRLLITVAKGRVLSQLLKPFVPSLTAVLTIEDLKQLPEKTQFIAAKAEDAAFIQYTSGSTGDPKGVLLSHQNLLANIRAIGKALLVRPTDIMVSWLPLYHDMGLVGAWLGSLYFGIPICVLSPLTFLMRPERWLWAMHYHRGTIAGAPNFAYELCVNKIADDKIAGLDLSSWRLALNGSEAVQSSTMRKFAKKFSPYGFNPKAMTPAYGLAESTVALTISSPDREPKVDEIDRDLFTQQNKALPAKPGTAKLAVVSCGKPLPDHAVRIVNANNQPLAEREVGLLQFNGPSMMQGYFANPSATQAVFHQGWLNSGDLAYQADGEIYLVGRQKDTIITAGRNIYPEEIEQIARSVAGVRSNGIVAFSVPDLRYGTEQCVIVAETQEQNSVARQHMVEQITAKVAQALDITPQQVILVAPGVIPKTPNEKLQRSACKQAYLQNKLSSTGHAVWWQFSKIFFSGLAIKSWRALVIFSKMVYTAYVWLMISLTIIPLWLMILGCSHQTSRRFMSGWGRLILKLIFCRLKVAGQLPSGKEKPLIFVSNHASYADAVALMAVLPTNIVFIAKRSLLKVPVLRTFIKKLDCVLVERADFSESIQDTAEMHKHLLQGRSVLIFPEGTFTHAIGLRAFKMGAFKLAVDTKVPLCPLGIKGTRRLFRGEQILLAPSHLTVSIGELIFPQQSGWEEIARLRDSARKEIAKQCGENPINLVSAGLI